MEHTNGDSSDKDREMQNKFESFDDDDDESEKKQARLFEKPKEEEKHERRGSIFEDKKAEEKKEKETPPEKLADDEKQIVASEYVEARSQEVKHELDTAQDDSPEEAEALANAALLEAIHAKIEAGEDVDETLLDDALAETADELGVEVEGIVAEIDETEAESEPDDVKEDEDASTQSQNTPSSTSTKPPIPPVPPVPPVPPTPPVPPVPPIPPVPSPPGPVPPGPGPGPNVLGPTPNVVTNPNVPPQPITVERHNARQRAGDLLLGGIIGYLIGRRRGRIKTEARLLPIQEKLEKEVKDLHEKIAIREDRIRKAAAEKAYEHPEAIRTVLVEKVSVPETTN